MKLISVLAVLSIVVTLIPAGAVGAHDDPPLADAGLDQTATRGGVVLLDGTGSHDPDGQLVSYRWTIESPNGKTFHPRNESASKTRFVPDQLGRYNVTLSVTDNDGTTRSDTLYVTVKRGNRPQISLTGPTDPVVGESNTYVARIRPGDAPLQRIVWQVDSSIAASRSISTDRRRARYSIAFADSIRHNITATVVDEDGLNGSAELDPEAQPVSIAPPSGGAGASGGSNGGGGQSATLAQRFDPTVSGKQLLTGRGPFSANYHLSGVRDRVIRSVTWYRDRRRAGTGSQFDPTWNPGTHRLFASVRYVDGTKDVARFADGSSDVTVDPEPTASFTNLNNTDGISGSVSVSDGFGHLRLIEVSVDGNVVRRWPTNKFHQPSRSIGHRTLSFDTDNVAFGTSQTVRVVAVDERGQQTTVSRSVTPTGEPHILESKFVNTPVDSYDRRIDASRYAAKHVLKIDLNGVPPSQITVAYSSRGPQPLKRVQYAGTTQKREFYLRNDTLQITSYWGAPTFGKYRLTQAIRSPNGRYSYSKDIRYSRLTVKNSPPEIRLNVTQDGVVRQKGDWGMIVDAGDSFDPDGSRIMYIWKQGAHPISPDNSIAKFSSRRRATLIVRDPQKLQTKRSQKFTEYYAPSLRDVTIVPDGSPQRPYFENDTVRLRVRTESYELTKQTYQIQLGIKVPKLDATVHNWHRVATQDAHNTVPRKYWTGTIEIPASELDSSHPGHVVIYNTAHPKYTKRTESISTVDTFEPAPPVYQDLVVNDLRYQLRSTNIDRVRVDTSRERNRFLTRGYQIDRVIRSDPVYRIEQRYVKTPAQYRTKRAAFDSAGQRRTFLRSADDWSTGETSTEYNTWTTTETEWHDDKSGRGQYTGRTRRVKDEPARYRTKRRYRHEYEVRRDGTRTVTETRTKTVQESYTRTIRKCTAWGCYRRTETFTRPVQKTVHVKVTHHYSYSVTRTDMYWAFNKYSHADTFTGDTKRIKVADAKYHTQYQFEYQQKHHDTDRTYYATKQVQVEPPQFGWKPYSSTKGTLNAYHLVKRDDYRIGKEIIDKKWVLSKQTSHQHVVARQPRDSETVLQTRASIAGLQRTRYFNPKTAEYREGTASPFMHKIKKDGYWTASEMKLDWRRSQSDQCDWDRFPQMCEVV